MSANFYRVEYDRLEGLGSSEADWIQNYMSPLDETGFFWIDEENISDAVCSARDDEEDVKKKHKIKRARLVEKIRDKRSYVPDAEVTTEVSRILREAVEKHGEFELSVHR